METTEIVIVAAGRSPIGTFNGSLSSLSAVEIGTQVLSGLLDQQPIMKEHIDEVILGQVLSAGCGQNPARQTALKAGLTNHVSALTINKVCGSGLKAVQMAAQALLTGDAEMVVAGGQESMSQAAHVLPNSRNGQKMGDWSLKDSMVTDGLWDAFNDYHMGITAENIAQKWNVSREEQDRFAVNSQQKAQAAMEASAFQQEIISIRVPQRRKDDLIIDTDEQPRANTDLEALSKLRPAFSKDGTVTAGNASTINDGAAMVVMTTRAKAESLNLPILASVAGFGTTGCDPQIMGTGPIHATRKCLDKVGWSVDELDLVEANEAFAVQALTVNNELGLDAGKVNVNGGAIALGHPIGASGCRILVTLLYAMQAKQAKKGLATLCIGGGMGIAAAIIKKRE